MNSSKPTFSIITVVYNGEDLLEGTIKSVLEQDYPNIEYLIIDGASSDGTIDIIKKYESNISRWISEKDKGIYDAMNTGLHLASGDFVWFMNCGDRIFEPTTCSKMAAACKAETEILFGEVMLVDEARKQLGTRSEKTTRKLPASLDWKSLNRGMVVSHQAFLSSRKIAPKYIDNNLSADIDWVIKCLKKSKLNTNTNLVLAEFLLGGISTKRRKQSWRDRFQVLQSHYGFIPNLVNHFLIFLRAISFKLFQS